MKLEENEFTENMLLNLLIDKFKTKRNGNRFTKNDIVQYTVRGKIPKWYGGYKIEVKVEYGIKLLVLTNGE